MGKAKLFHVLFIGISLLHIIGKFFQLDDLSNWTKPLILTFLLLFYLNATVEKMSLYIGAVLFSLLGDVLLIFNGELNFILGLLSFLIAHVLFIVIVFKDLRKSTLKAKLGVLIPFSIVCLGLILFLKDSLGEMLIPVIVYAAVISAFGAVSLLNYMGSRSRNSLVLFLGSVLFITSDSILAIDKFYESKALFSVLIMLTYISAQYLICRFMIGLKS